MDTKTTNELANAPPGTIMLGGETFIVAQPNPGTMGAIGVECKKIAKAKRAALFLERFREFKDIELARQLASEECPEPDDTPQSLSETLQREMMAPDGCRFAAFLMLREHQPEITPAKLRELITADNAAAVGIDLLMASGLARAVPNSPGANGSPSKASETTQPSTSGSENPSCAAPTNSPA